ncbi:MAG: N-acylglucosamine 2-epimerase [Spirochaetae bacterium HGW-Spirochaetae-8]|jgi:N-acylglucosamine 2-epimerase|nr:MAG: N-acylglucosamine 2-epimerase [Spirochaetae bacterium HGW-Spirochaetae-8]
MYPRSPALLAAFYHRQLQQDLIPFWDKAWDSEVGGVFTCFCNDGSRLLSTDKYVWSQGRFLWLLSHRMAMVDHGLLDGPRDALLEQARLTCGFLLQHALLDPPAAGCAFLLSREGEKKESIPGKGFHTSFYADCFVILGLAEYARVTGLSAPLEHAFALYRRTIADIEAGCVVSEPYPIPPRCISQSVPMILCDVSYGLAQACVALSDQRQMESLAESLGFARTILSVHYDQEQGLLHEIVPLDERDMDTLVARHVNPGHAIESMWFCGRTVAAAEAAGLLSAQEMEELGFRAARVVERSIAIGWDPEYGGLLRFCDREGGSPQGRLLDCPYERQLVDTWDAKLWWVHSEALYSTLFYYSSTGDSRFWNIHQLVADYIFSTFPNTDRQIGEWVQIRDRQGLPIERVMALPVKDPYHIMRDFLLILELLCTDR